MPVKPVRRGGLALPAHPAFFWVISAEITVFLGRNRELLPLFYV